MVKVEIDETQFYEELEEFSPEFRELLDSMLPPEDGDTWEDAMLGARDKLLENYWNLFVAYKAHGLYHKLDWNLQPQASKLGRKVAGVMFGILQDLKSLHEEAEAQQEPITHPNHYHPDVRFDSVVGHGKLEDVRPKEKPAGPGRTAVFARYLEDLEPGYYIDLSYSEYEDLKRDQALLRNAAQMLGWFEDLPRGYLPWQSWSSQEGSSYILRVARLDSPWRKGRA